MRTQPSIELLAMIEETLALADALGAAEVGLWLDRARIAAGGSGNVDSDQLRRDGLATGVTIRVEAVTIGGCATATE